MLNRGRALGTTHSFAEGTSVRRLAIGAGIVAISGLLIGAGESGFTSAQDSPATPSQLLVCGTPFATPAPNATPIYSVESTPMAGVGFILASPGAVSSGTCTTEPS